MSAYKTQVLEQASLLQDLNMYMYTDIHGMCQIKKNNLKFLSFETNFDC